MARSSVKTTEIDRGEKAIRARIAEMAKSPNGPHVKTGILASAGDQDGKPVVFIAICNEFGTHRIPERGFMRASAEELMPIMQTLSGKLLGLYVEGKITMDGALDQLGLKSQSVIKKTIRDWEDPPNAPSTIRAKGADNPLEDTGQMRNSVQYEKVP